MTVHGARGRGSTERQVEHGPQVLLELPRHGAVHRPVAAVVRAHRQLVDDVGRAPPVSASGTSNISTASTPVTPSSPAMRSPASVATRGEVRVEVRRRGEHLGADAVGLHRLDDRPGRRLAGRAAGDEHGELADEVDLLLEQQAVGQQPTAPASRATCSSQSVELVGGGRPHARPCRRSRRGASWRRWASRPASAKSSTSAAVRARAQRGTGDADRGEPLAHGELVLGEVQRRAGWGAARRRRPRGPSSTSAARARGRR